MKSTLGRHTIFTAGGANGFVEFLQFLLDVKGSIDSLLSKHFGGCHYNLLCQKFHLDE